MHRTNAVIHIRQHFRLAFRSKPLDPLIACAPSAASAALHNVGIYSYFELAWSLDDVTSNFCSACGYSCFCGESSQCTYRLFQFHVVTRNCHMLPQDIMKRLNRCGGEYLLLLSRDVSDTSIVDARGTVALQSETYPFFASGTQPMVEIRIFFKSANFVGEAGPRPSARVKHVLGPFPPARAPKVTSSTCDRPDVAEMLTRLDAWAAASGDAAAG